LKRRGRGRERERVGGQEREREREQPGSNRKIFGRSGRTFLTSCYSGGGGNDRSKGQGRQGDRKAEKGVEPGTPASALQLPCLLQKQLPHHFSSLRSFGNDLMDLNVKPNYMCLQNCTPQNRSQTVRVGLPKV
jgi:hypothetical protein